MTSIKLQKELVSVLELELNVFISDPVIVVHLSALQCFTILLFNTGGVPLHCLFLLVSINQVSEHTLFNHFGLVCTFSFRIIIIFLFLS